MISDFVSFMNYKLKHFVDAVDIMREIKHLIRLMFFAYLETLISLGMEADFPNAGKGGLVLMKKLHGACLRLDFSMNFTDPPDSDCEC